MKFQDSSFNGLKVTVGTKSVTHPRTHAPTHTPKAICPINFFKVGDIKSGDTIFSIISLWCYFLDVQGQITPESVVRSGQYSNSTWILYIFLLPTNF